jgi:serine protease Do
VTLGIVSAKGRSASALIGSDYGYELLQTDAAINPGNSGGPLCTIDGTVMGVNTAIYTRSGGYMGIGFAIPSNLARSIADTLIKGGKVVRGWLGVAIQPLDEGMAKDLGIKEGVLIHSVQPNSPAEKAGLKAGDIIVEVGGKPAKDVSQVQRMVSSYKPGEKAKIKVINYDDKKSRTVEVKIGELPAETAAQNEGAQPEETAPDKLGLSVSPAPKGDGVLVEQVEPGSIGEQIGLERGDRILTINRKSLHSVADYRKQVKSSGQLTLLVNRKGQKLFFRIPE